jgi:uncharacterized repeat protein (TIGR03803 family)
LAYLNGSNGAFPKFNGLVQGTDGNLYGVAADGGASNQGSVYKVAPDQAGPGGVSLVYSFCSLALCVDGFQPEGSLLLGADGNFMEQPVAGGQTISARFSN